MATIFDHLTQIDTKARAAYNVWEAQQVNFSQRFLGALQRALGFPDSEFRRLSYQKHNIPHGTRFAPGAGFVSKDGYHFMVRVEIMSRFFDIGFACRGRPDGSFEIRHEEKVTVVDGTTPDVQPFAEDIKQAFEKRFEEDYFTAYTGYKP